MWRVWFVSMLALLALAATPRLAHADEPTARGYVVVAVDAATDVAWPFARAVYGSAHLRPDGIDDARARILAGERPPPLAPPELTDLAELRAGVKGDDAASREVLGALAHKLNVRGIIVVLADPPSARVYDASTHTFDAARYVPDASSLKDITWDGAIRSLERPYLPQQPLPVLATAAMRTPAQPTAHKSESKPFYESPWFWVAVGTAVLIGGGVLIATNVQTSDTIHLQMRLP